MKSSTHHIKQAEKGTIISIIAYVFLACSKVAVGMLFQSAALLADGLNNSTDVIASVTVLIGLYLSRKPVDADHPYGHWKFETIASFITSFIMFFIGIEVLQSAVFTFQNGQFTPPSIIGISVATLSGFIMLSVYRYNLKLAQSIHSIGLQAAAKDNLSDALTSFATAISMLASYFGHFWVDTAMAFIVGCIIIKTAVDIFKECAFALTDGFDVNELEGYRTIILQHPDVRSVRDLKARRYGANVYLDVTILLDGQLSVFQSHAITEEIETILETQCSISFIDIHVEPDHT